METNDTNKSEVAKREEEILKFWRENRIFEKSLEKTAEKKEYVFYDGPPFATGLPHFGHLLPTSLKDAIPRYQTMRGFHVGRRWGWDCHGLPIENLIEKELGLRTKKDIETLGIEVFNRKARESVLRYADQWQKIIPRVGRWVDMDHAYRTMDPSYTENVWSVFKALHDKNLVYEGYKSMHLCPRCETTLANFEVSQGYKDVADLSVTVKFELVDGAAESFFQVLGNNPQTMKKTSGRSVFFLAWTTTPWTLPGNVALAVNPSTNYVRIKANDPNGEVFYILGKERLESVMKDQQYEIVEEFSGKKLIGKKYQPLFGYYQGSTLTANSQGRTLETGWQVYAADFVNTEEGTGIVHIAPGFGEDDLALGQREKLPFVQHVGVDGKFKLEVTDFAGLSVKPKDDPQATDILIIKHLAKTGALFAKEKITHPYPHCWRCDTPLLNYTSSSWFVAVTKIKDALIKANKKISWIPEHIKDGRFGKWLEGARDWAVSRSRFWGAPLPVWRCESCKKVAVVGSLEELKEKVKTSGNHYWIMRHGEAENNVKHVISSRVDNQHHLTEVGQKQVLAAAKKLKTEKIDLIISSDFARTKETAEILKRELSLTDGQIIVDEHLREFNSGDFNNKSIEEYHRYFATTLEKFTKGCPGGENLQQVKNRMTQLLYQLEQKYYGKNILLVSHETPLAMLVAGSQSLDLAATVKLKDTREDFIQKGEVMDLVFKPLPHNPDYELDFHRPYIDQIKLRCECGLPAGEAGGDMTRIQDVFDVWFESGSMPYIQPHFPADFIAEGLDQTRGWFYVMLVLSVALRGESAYRRVVVNGLILAEDGQKMSKRLNNFPDLMPTINQYGADALRFYLLSSPAVRGEEFNFAETGLREVGNRVLGRLRNVVAFYEMYAAPRAGAWLAPSDPATRGVASRIAEHPPASPSPNVLDRWITARLNQLISEVTSALDRYELDQALRPVDLFIDDLSTWYLRRSRERLKSDASVLRQVLLELSKVMAPFTPFIAEEIYRGLNGEKESVHLEDWPHFAEASRGEHQLLEEMLEVRKIVSLGLEARAKAAIKVRQPLGKLKIKSQSKVKSELLELIKDEMNVKEIIFDPKLATEIELDTTLTPALKEEGELRDLTREIQDWRKAQGLKPGEAAVAPIPVGREALVKKYASELKRLCHVTFASSH